MSNWRDSYATYINLDHRTDRKERLIGQFDRIGMSKEIDIHRTRGMYFNEYDGDKSIIDNWLARYSTPQYMKNMLGCHFSHIKAMRTAFEQGKNAFVFEDDLDFASDTLKRLDYAQEFLNKNEWDVFWLGGTYHLNPPMWHNYAQDNARLTESDKQFIRESGFSLGRDVEPTNDIRIVKTYGCWSTYAYLVNINSLERILKMFDDNVHRAHSPDHLFIILQPYLKTFAFVPAMCKQYDGHSDIGNTNAYFSTFANLGQYWYADKMEQFNPNSIDWSKSIG